MSMTLILDGGTLVPKLKIMKPAVNAALKGVMEYHAASIQDRMRNEAPWTDRTGNARNGLFARAGGGSAIGPGRNALGQFTSQGSGELFIEAFHTVPYGIFLEVSRGGKYRVIMPTLESEVGPVLQSCSRILAAL